jgi:hypothetical protein
MDAERLYRHGFQPRDFVELAPNLLLLRPMRRPEKMGGLHTVGPDPRFECLYFVVEAHGRFEDRVVDGEHLTNALNVGVGDTITIRNALAEPIQEDRKLYVVDVRWVWGVLERSEQTKERLAAEHEREAAAKAGIQEERARLVAGKDGEPPRSVKF